MNHNIDQIISIIDELHSTSSGCEWTKSQNFESLAPMTLEEVYELVESIEQHDIKSIKSELGDLLYHVLLYCYIAQTQKLFSLDDVIADNIAKHEYRMPEANARQGLSADEINAHWQALKAKARAERASVLSGVPTTLPALTRAMKLQTRAAEVGFDWPDATAVVRKVDEELYELREEIKAQQQNKIEDEFGDLLFACVNLGRHLNVDPETALRKANRKFTDRFQVVEADAKQQNAKLSEMSLDELEKLWQAAKKKLADLSESTHE